MEQTKDFVSVIVTYRLYNWLVRCPSSACAPMKLMVRMPLDYPLGDVSDAYSSVRESGEPPVLKLCHMKTSTTVNFV
jgi:hypothetical protein